MITKETSAAAAIGITTQEEQAACLHTNILLERILEQLKILNGK